MQDMISELIVYVDFAYHIQTHHYHLLQPIPKNKPRRPTRARKEKESDVDKLVAVTDAGQVAERKADSARAYVATLIASDAAKMNAKGECYVNENYIETFDNNLCPYYSAQLNLSMGIWLHFYSGSGSGQPQG